MSTIKKVNCPYCGAEIENSAEQCPSCGEFFVEPHIKNIKFPSIGQYIVFNILTVGLYSLFWIIMNYNAFSAISQGKDLTKLRNIFILTVLSFCLAALHPIVFAVTAKVMYLMLSYRILRIIEKYSYKKYNSAVTHSEAGWFFFDILYVVYFLDTYQERIHDPQMRNHMEVKNWLKYILILIAVVLVIFFINFIYVSLTLR